MIVGGGLSGENDAVWRAIVDASGGPGARIAVLPQASADPSDSVAWASEQLRARGGAPFPALAPSDAPAVATAGGVYMTGGAQGRLVDALAGGALLAAVRARHADGGAVAGSSAGAAVMSAKMFRDPDSPAALMQAGVRPGVDVSDGFGFLGGAWLVDQHFLQRDRQHRIFAGLCGLRIKRALGIDEDTALVINEGVGAVVGRSGVVVLTKARLGQCAPITQASAEVSILHAGDRVRLDTGADTPAIADPGASGAVATDAPTTFAANAAAVAQGRMTSAETVLVGADGAAWRFTLTSTRKTRWWRTGSGVSVSGLKITVSAARP